MTLRLERTEKPSPASKRKARRVPPLKRRREPATTRVKRLLAMYDFVPQMILIAGAPLRFPREAPLVSAHDDLDVFSGTSFVVDGVTVALKRYAGHPQDTFTVYLPADMNANAMDRVLDAVLVRLGIGKESVQWRRPTGAIA